MPQQEQNNLEKFPQQENPEKINAEFARTPKEAGIERAQESPEQFAQETIKLIDQQVFSLEREGKEGIEKANASVKLDPQKIQQVQEEMGVVETINLIVKNVQDLAQGTKNNIEQSIKNIEMKTREFIEEIKSDVKQNAEDLKRGAKGFMKDVTKGLKQNAEDLKRGARGLMGVLGVKSNVSLKQEKENKPKEPPIKLGEMFFPELELKEIRSLPKSQQRQALEIYKEKLAYQKKGLAKMQEDLIMSIRINPDGNWKDRMDMLNIWWEAGYGFTPQQRKITEKILSDYQAKHMLVNRMRSQYPDDKRLFSEVFGAEPRGEVEVIRGPMTFYFRCHNLDDYALIHSQAFVDQHTVGDKDKNLANLSGGVSIASAPSNHPELAGTIIAENAQGIPFDQSRRGILLHEEQHAIKRLFNETFIRENTFIAMKHAQNDFERQKLMANYFRFLRKGGESRIKDEILAFMKQGDRDSDEIFKLLTKSQEEGGIYDYFGEKKELSGKSDKEAFSGFVIEVLKRENDKDFVKLVQDTIEEVFGAEYKTVISNGLKAYMALQKAGYSKEQITALLIQRPLVMWGKEANRLLEQKNKKY